MERAYATLTVKAAVPGATRKLAGIATTPTPDRQGDTIEPLGASFANPIPLLLHHDAERPIGLAYLHPPTADGITFDATIATIDEPGPLRDRTNDAWQTASAGLLRGVSIGYRGRQGGVHLLKNGGRRFSRIEICELSLVTVPANSDATFATIKSLDAPYVAASGPSPIPASRELPRRGQTMTAQEQVTQFEHSRAAKVAAMEAIMSGADGATLADDKRDEFETLRLDVKSIDEHLTRARELDRLMSSQATRVPAVPGVGSPATIVRVKSNLAPGTAFVRAAMAILSTNGRYEAIEYAKRWERDCPEVGLYLKAAVAPGTSTDPLWAGPLAVIQNVPGEFIELLRPATILGKIPNLRRIPFNAQVPVQTAGGSYGWVGQGLAKPVTSLQFGSAKLDISKAAGIVVLTTELVRLSDPAAEDVVRRDMIAGIAAFLDQQFIDPAVAAVAGVHPASITNGIVGIASVQDPYKDLLALLQAFSTGHVPLASATLIVSETNALAMAFMRDAMGNRVFPNVTISGGTAEGINVVTSNAAGTNVILVWPPAILYADDGGVTIDVSKDASVQMDSVPANPSDATTVLVSLWQNNLVGLRAERFINWKRAINAGVALVTGANYPAIGG